MRLSYKSRKGTKRKKKDKKAFPKSCLRRLGQDQKQLRNLAWLGGTGSKRKRAQPVQKRLKRRRKKRETAKWKKGKAWVKSSRKGKNEKGENHERKGNQEKEDSGLQGEEHAGGDGTQL